MGRGMVSAHYANMLSVSEPWTKTARPRTDRLTPQKEKINRRRPWNKEPCLRKPERIFRQIDVPRAKSLLNRLSIRRAGDKMSMYFHDHLSTPTRVTLVATLQKR